jgi:hypothetical protein
MAADQVNPDAGKMDFPAHQRNYTGFIKALKVATLITGLITALVLLIIAD